jgi:hypothetical protein
MRRQHVRLSIQPRGQLQIRTHVYLHDARTLLSAMIVRPRPLRRGTARLR